MQCNLTVAYDFSDGLVKKKTKYIQVFFFLNVNGMIVPNNSPPPPPPHHHHRRHDCSGIVSLLFFLMHLPSTESGHRKWDAKGLDPLLHEQIVSTDGCLFFVNRPSVGKSRVDVIAVIAANQPTPTLLRNKGLKRSGVINPWCPLISPY